MADLRPHFLLTVYWRPVSVHCHVGPQYCLLFHQVSQRKWGPVISDVLAYVPSPLPRSGDRSCPHSRGDDHTRACHQEGRLWRHLLQGVSALLPLLYFKFLCICDPISVTPPNSKEWVEEEKPAQRKGGGAMELCSSFPSSWHWSLTLVQLWSLYLWDILAAGFSLWLNLIERLCAAFVPTLRSLDWDNLATVWV